MDQKFALFALLIDLFCQHLDLKKLHKDTMSHLFCFKHRSMWREVYIL